MVGNHRESNMQPSSKNHPPELGTIPKTGFVRLKLILTVIPICKSSWWAGVKSGKYPAPVRPSPFGRSTVWRSADIRRLIDEAGERTP